jgi:hypothetical protein
MTASRLLAGLVLAAGLCAACEAARPDRPGAAPRPADRITLVHVEPAERSGSDASFTPGEPIHIVLNVAGIPAGTRARVDLRDRATGRVTLSHQLAVQPGRSLLTFVIAAGAALPAGAYDAQVTLGDTALPARSFRVAGAPG